MDEAFIWPHDRFIHGYWVEPRLILAGEYPGHPDPEHAAAKIDLLLDNGIRTFVDLTETRDGLDPYEPLLESAAERHGFEVIRAGHPIPDMGVLPVNEYDKILATIREATGRGGVYIHCWGGIGRTATVVGCWFVEMGLSGEGAMRTIKERRQPTRKADMRAPQTHQQRDIIFQRAALRHREERLGHDRAHTIPNEGDAT